MFILFVSITYSLHVFRVSFEPPFLHFFNLRRFRIDYSSKDNEGLSGLYQRSMD